MIVACVGEVLIVVGFPLLLFGGAGFLMAWMELERLPGTGRRWRAVTWIASYDHGREKKVAVGLRKRGARVAIAAIDTHSENFEDELAEAVSEVRRRAIALNAAGNSLSRRLPA